MWACQMKQGWKGYTKEELKDNHYKIAVALVDAGADINHEAVVMAKVTITNCLGFSLFFYLGNRMGGRH